MKHKLWMLSDYNYDLLAHFGKSEVTIDGETRTTVDEIFIYRGWKETGMPDLPITKRICSELFTEDYEQLYQQMSNAQVFSLREIDTKKTYSVENIESGQTTKYKESKSIVTQSSDK